MKRFHGWLILVAGLSLGYSLPAAAAAPDGDDDYDHWIQKPHDRFVDGRRAFDEARDMLLKHYYKEGISEEDLYRAAVQGMLQNVEPRMRRWNRLLSPTEMKELQTDMQGEMVGIGVEIKFDAESGISDVIGVIPGSPAERAGIVTGDKILNINGKFYKGMQMRDVVADIRGKAGEMVSVAVLRRDQVLQKQVKRDRLQYEAVSQALLPDGVGYIQVHLFSQKTVPAMRAALDELMARKPRGLIVDLRGNQGGLFDEAVAAAGLFLPRGKGIVSIVRRGGKEESFVNKTDPRVAGIPIVVLVDHLTSSGAEFVAAALQEGIQAQVVGTRTFGKWTVQMLDELSNHFTVKYTSALFRTPAGKSYEGEGLIPDVDVEVDAKQTARLQHLPVADRLASDMQLRAAHNMLTRH